MISQKFRESLLPKLDRIARKVGYYTMYQLNKTELVGTIEPLGLDVIQYLKHHGYEYNGLAAAKQHWETKDLDDGSYRKVDPENPTAQWHVHIFEFEGQTQLPSHYELRPDVTRINNESYSDMIRRLITHYRPKKDQYIEGYSDPSVSSLVE